MTTDNLKVGDKVLFSRWRIEYIGGDASGEWEYIDEAIITATTDGAVKLDFGRGLFNPNGWYRLNESHIKIEKITT